MRRVPVFALVLLLAACGGDEDASPPTTTVAGPPATAPEEEATTSEPEVIGPVAVIQTATGQVVVPVEVADSPEERQVGLMNRESLPDEAGMIFLFEGPTTSGFWMKDTLIPLSIAFADEDGVILRILDMEPCEAEPCEIYDPGVSYWSALEVNQGALAGWGVEEGDRLRLEAGR